jgi:hypothetical protein
MSGLLRPETLPPIATADARIVALCAGLTVASAIALVAWAEPARAPSAPIVSATPITSPPAAASKELLLVFRAGGDTYVRIADVAPESTPKHGPLRLVDDLDGVAAIGAVNARDLPAPYRAYEGKRLRVDGECSARVTDLALVGRLVGDPAYAGLDEAWSANTVMRHGAVVLAARIDGCPTGTYARDAALAPVVRPARIFDEELAEAARAAFLASRPAADAQRAWTASGLEGTWSDRIALRIEVLRHPTTQATWVTVYASDPDGECGGPDVNLWGLFRAGRDRTLEAVDVRKLDTLYSIDHVIDVDGDGAFELIGKTWLGTETVVVGATGEGEIDRLPRPFHGCGC